ncbi:hypothetical protein [Hymenobacter sp. 5516J-16]|uniref:hypothetical protein n=1 Tax=Hymenobacter sp. 5516J-16 TaxID=2932253 RepID=UPI00293F6424|nr:hypothetical protein [Hymenobacter sp. 5516J-16]
MPSSASNYGFSTAQKDVRSANPLPRAVLRSNNYLLLDGEWNFALDSEDIGLRDGWYLAHPYEQIANWPGSVEEHMAKYQPRLRPGRIKW